MNDGITGREVGAVADLGAGKWVVDEFILMAVLVHCGRLWEDFFELHF